MNIIIRDCVKGIQSGIDGSEYRYLGTGFNTQTQVRSSTSTLFSHVDLHVPGDSIVARPVTRILGTLGCHPPGSKSSSFPVALTSLISQDVNVFVPCSPKYLEFFPQNVEKTHIRSRILHRIHY